MCEECKVGVRFLFRVRGRKPMYYVSKCKDDPRIKDLCHPTPVGIIEDGMVTEL